MQVNKLIIKELAQKNRFELAGIAAAVPLAEAAAYSHWAERGLAGRMSYLTDHRASIRYDPKQLLGTARSVIALGKVYNAPVAATAGKMGEEVGWISRYAWGEDYHDWMRSAMERLVGELLAYEHFEYRICVDTAPLLERGYARMAGLGWIGRNTCLINQGLGSWVFLGEILTSLELEPDSPPPDRCGTCRRCIDSCPTGALVPNGDRWELDARLCISYFTIELRGAIAEEQREGLGRHVFGCDICQDACPWNRRAAVTAEAAFQPVHGEPPLEKMAALSEGEFREMFRGTPVSRARYAGFLRNVAVAMGNSGVTKFRGPLEKMAASELEVVAEHARWALGRLAG